MKKIIGIDLSTGKDFSCIVEAKIMKNGNIKIKKMKTMKKEIIIKQKIKGRIEIFTMKIKLFGIRSLELRDFKNLLFPKRLTCLYK